MVGLQVWRGAFLLADFLLHSATNEDKNLKIFHDDIVIELGAGTGLTSIVAGMVVGYLIDGKYFGVMEGGFTGLVAGAFVTAYIDANSLPSTSGAT